MPCICGLPQETADCCGRYLDGRESPRTAEALMRSRYAAYVGGNIDYIMNTHDPATVNQTDRSETQKWSRSADWDGLEVLETEEGQPYDDSGRVEFIAHYRMNGQAATHHERSSFRKIAGLWYFSGGEVVKPAPVVRTAPKTGRNDPCPCGSGQKYKKCCGKE